MRLMLYGARFFAGAVLLGVMLVACDRQPTAPRAQRSPEVEASPTSSRKPTPGRDVAGCLDLPEKPPEGKTRVELWFADRNDGSAIAPLLVVHRDIRAGDAIAAATLRAWLDGPTREEKDAGAYPSAPEASELLGVDIDDGTAVIDFAQAFENTGLGTVYEGAVLEQLAGTVTQFDTVDRALLKIEGRFQDFYMGHGFIVDEDHPLSRPAKNRYRIAPRC